MIMQQSRLTLLLEVDRVVRKAGSTEPSFS